MGEQLRAPAPGVVHTPVCPSDVAFLVPCPPCLLALLEGRADQKHTDCELTTKLAVTGGRLVFGPEQDCPCRCPLEEESEALRTARAAARRSHDE